MDLSHLDYHITRYQEQGITPVILIYGPTGCGKTSISLDIAKQWNGEIISVDARQVYRGMDIGTGKITPSEMEGIPHHMLDIIDPNEIFSVVEYQRQTLPIIDSIRKGGKTPILCGGTGLYIDSVIFRRSYVGVKPNWERRRSLETVAQHEGREALWQMLAVLDPETAQKVHPNHIHGVIRAIEIIETAQVSKSDIHDTPELISPTVFCTPYDGDRGKLYEKINLRVEKMFEDGLVDEVRSLRDRSPDAPGLSTIGYREVCDFLDGTIDLSACITLVKQHNRNYAKRQITWNKKYDLWDVPR